MDHKSIPLYVCHSPLYPLLVDRYPLLNCLVLEHGSLSQAIGKQKSPQSVDSPGKTKYLYIMFMDMQAGENNFCPFQVNHLGFV